MPSLPSKQLYPYNAAAAQLLPPMSQRWYDACLSHLTLRLTYAQTHCSQKHWPLPVAPAEDRRLQTHPCGPHHRGAAADRESCCPPRYQRKSIYGRIVSPIRPPFNLPARHQLEILISSLPVVEHDNSHMTCEELQGKSAGCCREASTRAPCDRDSLGVTRAVRFVAHQSGGKQRCEDFECI